MKDHHYYRLGHGLQLSEFTPLSYILQMFTVGFELPPSRYF